VVASSKPLPHLAKVIDFILTPLFDLGFKVGYSVRTIADCVEIANRDMQTKTSLIETRLIIGDAQLFEKFRRTLKAKCVDNHVEEYIQARLRDQASRRSRFGNSPTMQEPNIKNGCGGLRDFQNLCWMALFKHGTRSLRELEEKAFITAREAKQLESAYDFLLRTRNELHYQVERPIDALTKSYQPAVAGKLGYTDRSPRKRLEAFMKEYYTHSRNIYIITREVEDRLALLPRTGTLPALTNFIRRPFARNRKPEPAVDGFQTVEGKIRGVSNRVFRDQPRRLMRVFLHSQQRGLPLHPDTTQAIRNQLHLVDRKFIHDEHVRETFLEILNQKGSVASILRSMHEVGLLGKYLPEFGRMTCRVQHEFYHQYTADEHTLMCLQKLDEMARSEDHGPYRKYHEIFREVERPFVLYLAMLLHDAGKSEATGNHALAGGKLAAKVARRLGLDGATTHALRLLIEEHLTMAHISQRRDLGDPEEVTAFAQTIQNFENLRMLTLHTCADSLATSDKLWNDFKESLLWELHHKTRENLLGGSGFLRAEAKLKELLAQQVREELPKTIHEEEIQAHFRSLPARYYQIYPVPLIARDVALAHRFMARQLSEDPRGGLEAFVSWTNDPDRGYTSAKVCTWDRTGLFNAISGAFAASDLNILGAQVFTRSDNIVLDEFYVTESGGGLVGRDKREAFEELLNRILTGEDVDIPALLKKYAPQRSRTETEMLEEKDIWFRIQFDNQSSQDRTVIEIQVADRPSLLYHISKTLTEAGLNIFLAKIVTDMGGAVDSFYVAEKDGGRITSPQRQKQIEKSLRQALA
jgi:[protein-PII] uridylyltransferase